MHPDDSIYMDYTIHSVWSKTTLITGGVGGVRGAGVDSPA